MRKFTLLTSLMALFAISSMADTKIVYRDAFASDASKANWTNSRGGAANDATSFVTTEDGGFMQFGNGSANFNGTRFSSIWGTTPWEGVTIPNDGYTMEFWFCFNKFGNNSSNANQRNNEIAIISADEATNEGASKALANYWGNAGTDYVKSETETIPVFKNYLFKISQNPEGSAAGEGGYVGNGSCGFFINGGTDEVRLAEGSWYKVVLTIVGQNVAYAISDLNETALAGGNGVRTLDDGADNRAGGLLHYQARYLGITQIGLNLQISYATTEAIANEPTVSLFAVKGNDRVYKAVFGEDETLHYSFNGVEQPTRDYWDNEGKEEITVTESCLMEVWTTKLTATSSKVSQNVECGWIKLVDPVVAIASVSEGFGKTYKVTFDPLAAQHLLAVESAITYSINGGAAQEVANGGTIDMPSAGTLKVTVNQIPQGGQKYYIDSEVTINNDVEYVVAKETKYIEWDDAHFAGNAAWTASKLEDSNMSHWAGHWQAANEYDLDEKQKKEADPSYEMKPTQNPVKVYRTDNSYDLPIYNLENDAEGVNYKNELLPLIPNTVRGNLAILLEEGLFVNGTSYNNLELSFDPQWTTDDQAKPNFIEIRKTNNYDRYDKGPGRHITDIVKTDDTTYTLYRFDTAIHSARVFTYKGFTPSTGIEAIKNVKTFNENAPIFNLNGVRVQNAAQKGIYIQNGKKFVVK